MSPFSPQDKATAQLISRLSFCNPFLPERIELEKEILGNNFEEKHEVWHIGMNPEGQRPNVAKLRELTESIIKGVRGKLANQSLSKEDQELYQDVVYFYLYHNCKDLLQVLLPTLGGSNSKSVMQKCFEEYSQSYDQYLDIPGLNPNSAEEKLHLFACFFQLYRAFYYIFTHIAGGSKSAFKLRAQVWQSIFTYNMKRYLRSLYRQMGHMTTLITGPSGTGKELVARAIGLSRYIPFNDNSHDFVEDYHRSFVAVNLSAISPTLIESELFGHVKGSFTGAHNDRSGWLESCPELGTVFLDEIGELSTGIQVKLLRVLQSRVFQRVGDTKDRLFRGKLIAATHRQLFDEMEKGAFREDFYYRLCSDMISTPSLQQTIEESPVDLQELVLFAARRIVDDHESQHFAEEATEWIKNNLGLNYAWPGNFRELEQCLRNLLVRKNYAPPKVISHDDPDIRGFVDGSLTADELLSAYCTRIYKEVGTYEETAKRLNLDRRTVKSKIKISD